MIKYIFALISLLLSVESNAGNFALDDKGESLTFTGYYVSPSEIDTLEELVESGSYNDEIEGAYKVALKHFYDFAKGLCKEMNDESKIELKNFYDEGSRESLPFLVLPQETRQLFAERCILKAKPIALVKNGHYYNLYTYDESMKRVNPSAFNVLLREDDSVFFVIDQDHDIATSPVTQKFLELLSKEIQ